MFYSAARKCWPMLLGKVLRTLGSFWNCACEKFIVRKIVRIFNFILYIQLYLFSVLNDLKGDKGWRSTLVRVIKDFTWMKKKPCSAYNAANCHRSKLLQYTHILTFYDGTSVNNNNNTIRCLNTMSPLQDMDTMCPRSSDPFYIVSYYMKWSLLLVHFYITCAP